MPRGLVAQDLERSVRRGRHRERVMLTLARARRLTVRELADATGLPIGRVIGILVGGPPSYSWELSLVRLGVVRRADGWAPGFEITPFGLAQARHVRKRRRPRLP